MSTIISVGIAALVWLTALDKARTTGWWPKDPVQRANLSALIALALILSLSIPAVYGAIGRLTGVNNLSLLLANGLTVIGLWAFQPLVRHARQLAQDYAREHGVTGLLVEPTRVRRAFANGGVMVAVLLGICLLFALAPVRGVNSPDYDEFLALYATAPFMPAYTTLFTVYAAGMVGELFLLAALTGRKLPTRALRLRGYLQAAGWAAYIASLCHAVLYILLRQLGLAYPVGEARLVRHALIVGGIALLMSGGLLDLCAWGKRWLDYRRLYFLWRALWRAIPVAMDDASFPPARSTIHDALSVDDLHARLYRRMITIRDGIVALRPYADERVIARARLLCRRAAIDPEMAAAVIEAVSIRSAIRARGHNGDARREGRELAGAVPPADAGSVDLLAARELAHLLRVARAFRRSQLVEDALAEPLPRGHFADGAAGHQP